VRYLIYLSRTFGREDVIHFLEDTNSKQSPPNSCFIVEMCNFPWFLGTLGKRNHEYTGFLRLKLERRIAISIPNLSGSICLLMANGVRVNLLMLGNSISTQREIQVWCC
jgi:hypothetical protein